MDKEISSFTRVRLALLLVLVVFAVAIAGCETTKCASTGAKKDWQMAKQATEQGVTNVWQAIKSADDWIKENLW
jgi:hypothetical protein